MSVTREFSADQKQLIITIKGKFDFGWCKSLTGL